MTDLFQLTTLQSSVSDRTGYKTLQGCHVMLACEQ